MSDELATHLASRHQPCVGAMPDRTTSNYSLNWFNNGLHQPVDMGNGLKNIGDKADSCLWTNLRSIILSVSRETCLVYGTVHRRLNRWTSWSAFVTPRHITSREAVVDNLRESHSCCILAAWYIFCLCAPLTSHTSMSKITCEDSDWCSSPDLLPFGNRSVPPSSCNV